MVRVPSTLGFAGAGLCVLALASCDSEDSTAPFRCNAGQPDTVNYAALGTFDTTSFDEGGVTVTSSGTIHVLNFNGLGVVGGASATIVDGTEWLRFTFDAGAADSVAYFTQLASNLNGDQLVGKAFVQAYDPSGVPLGVRSVSNAGSKDVSTMFGGVPISAFDVTADVDGIRIAQVSYSPCQ